MTFPIVLRIPLPINLYSHQKDAIEKLKSGSILCGGVGSGKSLTALGYYYLKECGGNIDDAGMLSPMETPRDLYIITTARKRDTLEWEQECAKFLLSPKESSVFGVKLVVDSWNNVQKYVEIKDAFFIFDEQRVIGSGSWAKSFIKISRNNRWILLSATPGDTWMDYASVFIANGFYKNRTEFCREHVVYNSFTKFRAVDHYVNCKLLIKHRNDILVDMPFEKKTVPHNVTIRVNADKDAIRYVMKRRWDIFNDEPVVNVSQLCQILRKITNVDKSRIESVREIIKKHPKLIIFYRFDYELDILKELADENTVAEWNGHKHEPIPATSSWVYLVQYASNSEGWNCTDTNAILFYSLDYSYKTMKQSAGRIDRLNTPFTDLYYYYLCSDSLMDKRIMNALRNKRDFNESKYDWSRV